MKRQTDQAMGVAQAVRGPASALGGYTGRPKKEVPRQAVRLRRRRRGCLRQSDGQGDLRIAPRSTPAAQRWVSDGIAALALVAAASLRYACCGCQRVPCGFFKPDLFLEEENS